MLLNKTQLLDKNTPLSLRDISPGGGENTRPLSRITINCRFFSPHRGEWPKSLPRKAGPRGVIEEQKLT